MEYLPHPEFHAPSAPRNIPQQADSGKIVGRESYERPAAREGAQEGRDTFSTRCSFEACDRGP